MITGYTDLTYQPTLSKLSPKKETYFIYVLKLCVAIVDKSWDWLKLGWIALRVPFNMGLTALLQIS